MLDVLNLSVVTPYGVSAVPAQIRIVGDPARPQFVAADLARVLGIQNLQQVVATFDDDEKGSHVVQTADQSRVLTTVYETGLYRILAVSRKREAKAFQRWLFHDVLPCIRRHGGYPAPTPAPVPTPSASRPVRGKLPGDVDALLAAVQALWDAVATERSTDDQPVASQPGRNFHGYLTVFEYCQATHRELSRVESGLIGKRATLLCKEQGLKKGYHRGQSVNSYPVTILAKVFGDPISS